MRIISDFHDFYDCVQREGFDPTITYLRKKKIISKSTSKYSFLDKIPREYLLIGFCGDIFPCVIFDKNICYNIDEVNKVMDGLLKKREKIRYYSKKYSFRDREIDFIKYFNKYDKKDYEYLFKKYHTPIWVDRRNEFIVSDCLKQYDFFRIFDPYQAFQEISMYFGGVLGSHTTSKTKYQGKPMDNTVSDKDLIEAKGFDKFSFRKQKDD